MKKALLFWKHLLTNPEFWSLSLVFFVAFLASRHLFTPGYFNMHDDLQMMRQLEMEKCFLDMQIPCRWVPDMGFGYGFPLFNFYPPLPYYFGEILRITGFTFIDTAKLLFSVAFFASGVSMYYLAKNFFGRFAGVVAALFYIWAPYHSVDIFVRGAMNEAWALIWFPAIMLASYKIFVVKKDNLAKWVILLGLFWAGLMTSHNLMVLIFTPVFAAWCLIWLISSRQIKRVLHLLISGLLAFGLVAFFTLPVVVEQKLVHANTLVMGYFEYTAHFATIKQILWDRFWDYGPSVWMDADDKMSFQVGEVWWILSIVVAFIAGFGLVRRIKSKKYKEVAIYISILFFVFVGWGAVFMVHSKSTPIWQAFEPLKFVQFPWRFLTLVIFAFSFSAGSIIYLIKAKWMKVIIGALCIFIILFNWEYFRPQGGKNGPLTDEQKFVGAAWDLQRTAGIYDYLPMTAKENPRDGQKTLVDVVEGEATVIDDTQGTDWAKFTIESKGESLVRINIYDFPDWRVFIDGTETQIKIPDEEKWGRMYITVPDGKHEVSAQLYNTPVRIVGNTITAITFLVLTGFVIRKRKVIFGR